MQDLAKASRAAAQTDPGILRNEVRGMTNASTVFLTLNVRFSSTF